MCDATYTSGWLRTGKILHLILPLQAWTKVMHTVMWVLWCLLLLPNHTFYPQPNSGAPLEALLSVSPQKGWAHLTQDLGDAPWGSSETT